MLEILGNRSENLHFSQAKTKESPRAKERPWTKMITSRISAEKAQKIFELPQPSKKYRAFIATALRERWSIIPLEWVGIVNGGHRSSWKYRA